MKISNIACQIVWPISRIVVPEDECLNSELFRMRLVQFAAQLSPPLRKAFELRDLDGRSVREAAHTLGVAEGTVKAQLFAGAGEADSADAPGAPSKGSFNFSPQISANVGQTQTIGTNLARASSEPCTS